MRFYLYLFALTVALSPLIAGQAATTTATPLNGSLFMINSTTAAVAAEARPEMTWQAIVVLVSIIFLLIALALNLVGATPGLILLSTFYVILGIISTNELFKGLVSTGMLAIALLFPVVKPMSTLKLVIKGASLLLQPFEGSTSTLFPMFKLCFFGFLFSPFIENAPHVALFTPLVTQLCRKIGVHPAQMLMSMSWSAAVANFFILGSTSNLIVVSLMKEKGLEPMSFFELTKSNCVPAFLMQFYFIFVPRFLFPLDIEGEDRLEKRAFSFTTVMHVPPDNAFVGKTIADLQASLDQEIVQKAEIVAIYRFTGECIRDFDETFEIWDEDEFVFSGDGDALQKIREVGDLRWVGVAKVVPGTEEFERLQKSEFRTPRSGKTPGRTPVASRTPRLRSPRARTPRAMTPDPTAAEPFNDNEQRKKHLAVPDDGGPPMSRSVSDIMSDSTQPPAEEEEMVDVVEIGDHQLMASRVNPQTTIVSHKDGKKGHFHIFNLTLSNENPAVDTRVQSLVIPRMYHATIIGVRALAEQRNLIGPEVQMHLLQPGDQVLVLAEKDFMKEWGQSPHFYVVESVSEMPEEEAVPKYIRICNCVPSSEDSEWIVVSAGLKYLRLPSWHPNLTILVFLGIIAAAMAGIDLALAAMVGIIAMVFLALITPKEALDAVDWNVYLSGAFSFGIGSAMANSGLAAVIGQLFIDIKLTGFPLLLVLALFTSLLANVVNSKGTVQVMFPIVYSLFTRQGLDVMPGMAAIANAAIAGAMTSYGFAPSLIIQGPGQYSALDFLKFGTPMVLIYSLLSAVMTSAAYGFW